jgi:glycine cleavage system H lipoate-binding protein
MSAQTEADAAPVNYLPNGMVAVPASLWEFVKDLNADLAAVKAFNTTGEMDTAIDGIVTELNTELQKAADKLNSCTLD